MTPETIEQSHAMQPVEPRDTSVMPGFNSNGSWELAQRIGRAFAASSLVPQQYQGNLANCIVALEMANRMGASPLMVMQNLYIVHGNPGWSSKFLIASFNQCGRFSSLRYQWSADRTSCRAWAIEKATGERIDGPEVSLEMAKAEGWSTKGGSKWKTMPELMLMYRAAAFLIRAYAPEISMGLRTDDEIIDTVEEVRHVNSGVDAVRAALTATKPAAMLPAAEQGKTFDQFKADIEAAEGPADAEKVLQEAAAVLSAEQMADLHQAHQMAWA
ncbi:MAG: hypothetical protein RLZZ182_1829 [Pseudomonadota bacterium]|jgi:hypothetical protein